MANVVPISPLAMTVTANGYTIQVSTVSVAISAPTYSYLSVNTAADSRGVYNMLKLGGAADTTLKIGGTFDQNNTVANRVIGDNVGLWPGLYGDGDFVILFSPQVGFTMDVVISDFEMSGDIFGTNPVQWSATMECTGNWTLTNTFL